MCIAELKNTTLFYKVIFGRGELYIARHVDGQLVRQNNKPGHANN